MKKRLIAVIAAVAMMAAAVPSAGAIDQWSYSEDVTIYINGDKIDNGQYKPIIVNDRTMVRLVPIFEALGFSHSELDQYNSVTFIKKDTNETYRFVAEKNYAIGGTGYDEEAVMSGQDTSCNIYFDVPATLQYYDVFYVPIRAFCDIAGLSISWDDATRSVYITSDTEVIPQDTVSSAKSISIGNDRAYTNDDAKEGIANLDITSSDSDSVMFTYDHRNQKDYNMGNVTAYLQDDGTYVARGEARQYILTPLNGNIVLTIIEGHETVVDNLLFEKL